MRINLKEANEEIMQLNRECEAMTNAAQTEGRELTHEENLAFNTKSGRILKLAAACRAEEAYRHRPGSMLAALGDNPIALLSGRPPEGLHGGAASKKVLSQDYPEAFFSYLSTNGQNKSNAALYEGSDAAGGFTVPLTVEGQVVPLAPTDMGVRSIASVIPTEMDLKIPRATTISTATAKAEGDGTGSNLFTESDPVLDQFTLSAFMAGLTHQISWELAQDVPSFQQFAVRDMLLAQQLYEENLFVSGTGNNQAQGLLGNVGAGVTGVAAGTDNYVSELLDATFNVLGTLKTAYHAGSSWLMSRATSVLIRKAQKQANLFEPVFTREGGKDYLHGYPVTYSTAMPDVATGKTPVLFGNFEQGYVIGDRGGSGIKVKILDQPKALEGLLVLLAYRRTDGRVRRSEAIQGITLA